MSLQQSIAEKKDSVNHKNKKVDRKKTVILLRKYN